MSPPTPPRPSRSGTSRSPRSPPWTPPRAADAPRVHPAIAGNVLFERQGSRGDVEGGFARAAVRLAETFTHGRLSGSPLEPRGLVASWTGDRLTVWMSTQAPT